MWSLSEVSRAGQRRDTTVCGTNYLFPGNWTQKYTILAALGYFGCRFAAKGMHNKTDNLTFSLATALAGCDSNESLMTPRIRNSMVSPKLASCPQGDDNGQDTNAEPRDPAVAKLQRDLRAASS